MTDTELSAAVDAYFEKHLDSEYWSGLDDEVKAGAVSMALFDVQSEIPGLTLAAVKAGSFALYAIAEQAVFLARNYENMTEGKVVTSEGLEGISQGYTLISEKVGISFRAVAFIKRAKSAISGASVRISRG